VHLQLSQNNFRKIITEKNVRKEQILRIGKEDIPEEEN
jgi:hypothetical protein